MRKEMFKLIAIISLVFASFGVAHGQENIAVVQNLAGAEAEAQRTALEGFKEIMGEHPLLQERELLYYNLAEREDISEIAEEIKDISPEMIVTFGSGATELIQDEIETIPVVFSMILNPVERGFVESREHPGNNLTGVTLNIPVLLQYELITRAFPDMEKIGVMYDPDNSAAMIQQAETAAEEIGLTLIKNPISAAREIPSGLEFLKGERADIIWALPDRTVYSGASVRRVLLFSLRNNIPVSGFSKSFVRAGAAIGIYNDYKSIGEQTAELSVKILAGEDPARTPLVYPEKMVYSLNRNAMDVMGISVDSNIIQGADQVFE